MTPRPYPTTPPEERFWRHVEKTDTCWLWTGATSSGYGNFGAYNRTYRAHRFSWLLEYGELPPSGKVLDHLCRVRACVRPSHLEPVDHIENVRRGLQVALFVPRDTCGAGHPMTPDNTTFRNNGKWSRCRKCRQIKENPPRQARRRAARLAALHADDPPISFTMHRCGDRS